MKAVYSWMFFGVMAIGLISGPSTLRAQPASEPGTAGDEPASTDDEPAPSDGEPAAVGEEPTTGDEAIMLDGPDMPWSQGVSMEDRKAARTLFLEGNQQFRIPLFARAAEKYVAALSKWKHPAIYLNLAVAQLNAGQEVEARESLERSLQYGKEPLGEENFRGAQLQLEEVTRHLGRIRVRCRTEGAQVTLDGVLLFIGPGSYEGWVKAKDHEITAKKPEYLSEARRVTVVPGQLQELDLKLITLSEAAEASRRWAVWKPWSVAVAGGAILAIAGTYHTLSFRNFKAFDAKVAGLDCGKTELGQQTSAGCKGDNPELLEFNRLLRRARRQQQFAVGGYVVGGSLAAAGIVLMYINRPRLAEREMPNSVTKNIALIPEISNDLLGAIMSVSY